MNTDLVLKAVQDVLTDYENTANLVNHFGYEIFSNEEVFAICALAAMGGEDE